jgi:hypothetical protein
MRLTVPRFFLKSCPAQKNGMAIAKKSISLMLDLVWNMFDNFRLSMLHLFRARTVLQYSNFVISARIAESSAQLLLRLLLLL